MKKNLMMRAASVLLVAVMLTTCAISGTFAKYVTSQNSSDTARVAKCGVTNAGYSDMFEKTYAKDDNTFTLADNTVVSADNEATVNDLVAPGTKGDLTNFYVTGSPEVAVRVKYEVKKFDLTNWMIEGANPGIYDDEYCPLIFYVNDVLYYINGTTIKTVSELENAVIGAINSITNDYEALEDLNAKVNDDLRVSWAWQFDDDVVGFLGVDGQDDTKDTAIGNWKLNAQNAPTVELDVEITITQID